MGHKIDQNGIRTLQDKLEAITKNENKLKSLLGAIQYLLKNIENLSAQTDIVRNLLENQNECMETPGFAETETVSSDSDITIAVPAINLKRYLRATGFRYINT